MNRRLSAAALLSVCVFFLAASLATAAEDIFKLVPDSASGFVVVNQPKALDAKLQALGSEMKLPVPSLLALVKLRFGGFEGVDENGTVGLVLLPPEGSDPMPKPILLVPVPDYDKFLGQFKPEKADGEISKITFMGIACWVRSIGGYAAITDTSNKEVLEKTLKLSSEVPAALAPWREWMSANDVGGVILKPGVQRLTSKVIEGIEMTKSSMANGPEQMKAAASVFGLYGKIFQVAAKEVSALGIGLQLDKQNVLRVVSRTELAPGGSWAASLAQTSADQENLLNGFAAGPFVVAGGGAVPPSAWDALLKFSTRIMKATPNLYGISEEKLKKVPEFSFDSMKGVHSMSMLMGVSGQGESLYSSIVTIMKVDNATEFLAAYQKDITSYGEFVKAVDSPMLQAIGIEKTELDGTPALKITMNAPKALAGGQIPQQARMMETFFGKEGKVEGWVVPADEHHVVIGYVNKDRVLKTVEAIKKGESGLAADASVAKTAELLPKDALSLVYLSPQGAVNFAKWIAAAVAPAELNVGPNIPEFPATPPIGFAVTSAPNELQTVLVFPADVLKAIGQYVGTIKGIRGGGAVTSVKH